MEDEDLIQEQQQSSEFGPLDEGVERAPQQQPVSDYSRLKGELERLNKSTRSFQALQSSYAMFQEEGYSGGFDSYFELLCNNPEALDTAYQMFQEEGFSGDVDDFKKLVGVEEVQKKNIGETGPSESEGTTIDSPSDPNLKTKINAENDKALTTGTFTSIKDLYENRPTKEEYYSDSVIPEITQLEDMPEGEDGGSFLQKLISATNIFSDPEKNQKSFVTAKDRGMSAQEMAYRKKKQEDFQAYKNGDKELDYITNLANNLTHQLGYLAGTDDRHKFAYAMMYRDLDALQASSLEIDRLDSYADPVYTPEDFFKDDEKTIGKFGMAVTTGLSGFLGSAVIGASTAGYGLFSDFASSQIYRYNKREADAKGIGLEEHLVSGDADVLTPATIGVIQGFIEKMQLGSISKAINKIPNSALKATVDFFKGVTANGAEEWGQESLEILSEHIADADAKGEVDPEEFGLSVANEMFSWRTGNAFLLGAFGSGAARLGGSSARRAFDLLKTDKQKQQDLENVQKLADIERIRSTKKKLTKDEKAALKIAEKRAKDALTENQKLVSDKVLQMTDDELEQMSRLYHEDRDLNSRIAGVENSTSFSEEEKQTYIAEILEEKKKVSDRIKTIEDSVTARDPQDAQVIAAPFFDFEVANANEAVKIRKSKAYLDNLTNLTQLATDMGVRVEVVDKTIGGYEHEDRGAVQEVSTVFNVISADMDKIAEFAAIAATKTAAVQDSTIAARYTEDGSDTHNADEWTIKVDNIDATLEALKEVGITEFTLNEDQGTVSFLDVFEFQNEKLEGNMNKLIEVLNNKGVSYDGKTREPVESRYIDRKERKRILQTILERLTNEGKTGTGLYNQVREAFINHERFLERRFPNESNIRNSKDKKKYKFTQTDNAEELAALKDKTVDPIKRDLIEQAEKAAKAFEAVAPDAVIRLHETKGSYMASVGGKSGRTSMGAYNRSTNIIHISLKDADASTVGHEVFHMLLRRKFTDDEQIQAATKELFDVLKDQVGGKTKEAIEDLVSNYAENKKDEERIVELFGLMSSNQVDIPKTSIQAIKQWVNKVAKLLGIGDLFKGKDVGRAEVIDIFKRLSTKVADGSQITDVDIHAISEENDQTEVNTEDLIRPKLIDDDETLTKRTVGPFDVQYFNETERFQQLIDDGRLVTHVDTSFITEDAEVVVHSPDNMFVGDIYYKGEKIIKGEGGLFYTMNTDNVWASTEQNLTSLVNTINKAVKSSKDGKAYMVLVGGSNSKMLGSISATSAALEVLNKMPDKGIFSKGDLRTIIAKVGKEQGIDVPARFGVEKMISHVNNTFLATEKPSFDDRRNFIQSIVSEIGKLDGVKNNKVANQKFREFLGMSDRSTLSKAGFTNNIANLLTEPLLQGLPSGHAYAAIEINGQVEGFKENSHRSYAGAVRQKEGVPTLHLFDKRENINNIVNTQEGLSVDEYKDPSVFRGKLGLAQAGLGIGRMKAASIEGEVMAKLTPQEQQRADRSDKGWKDVTEEGKRLLSPPKKSIKQRLKDYRNKFMTNWFDRQFVAKKKLLSVDTDTAKNVYNRLITAAGASAAAKSIFRKLDKAIYGGLSISKKEALDRIIAERRLIAIDENIEKRNKKLKNKKNLTKSYKRGKLELTANDARAALKRLRQDLGADVYNDLVSRSDVYFDAMKSSLKRLYDGGRITEEQYLNLRDIDYSPIRTIKFMLQENQDLYSQDSVDAQAEKYGMTVDDIKSLTEANEDAYVQDSRWLLRTQIAVTEKKYFQNQLLSQIGDLVDNGEASELGIVRTVPKMPGNPALRDKFLSRNGLAQVKYKNKGVDSVLFMPVDMARQILDIDPEPNVTDRFRKAGKLTGAGLLRFQATGGNLTFFVRNVPMDFLNVLFFTDAYGKFKLLSGAQLAIDGVVNAAKATIKTKNFKEEYSEFLQYGGGLDFLGVDGIAKIEEAKMVRGLKTAKQKAGYYFVKGLSHFNEIAELTFRMSVYNKTKNDLIKEFKKANDGGTPKGQNLDNILFEAAAKARASIDFAQGGVKARRLDKVLPYFNPAMQSARRVMDMASQKPIELSSNIVQAGLMASGVVAGMGMLMGYLMGTDDEDEIKEKIRQFREGLSEYEKSNYFTYPTGINADGSVEYVRIRKLPILSVPITLAEEVSYKHMWGVERDDKAIAESVLSSAPILPTNLLSRNPAVSAAFALGNYDTFRREDIFVNPDPFNPIPSSKEGAQSEFVNEIFKVTGDKIGFSPIRMQRAAEKLFTNPNTNPIVGLAYAGFEAGLSENAELKSRMKEGMDEFKKATSRSMIRSSNPDLQKYKQRAKLDDEIMEIIGKDYDRDQKFKRKVRDVLKEDPAAVELPETVKEEILKEFGVDDYMRARTKYTKYLTLKKGDSRIIDIGFQRNPSVAAKLIISGFGVMDPEVFEDFDLKVKSYTGKRLSNRVRLEYAKLYKEANR